MTIQEMYDTYAWIRDWYIFEGDYITDCWSEGDGLYSLMLTDSEGGKSLLMRHVSETSEVYLAENREGEN